MKKTARKNCGLGASVRLYSYFPGEILKVQKCMRMSRIHLKW